jgi:hypothetical protein
MSPGAEGRGSDWQAPTVRPERFPVKGLIEAGAREAREIADVAVPVTRVKAPRARVAGGREENKMVRDPPGGRLRGGQEGRAGSGPLALLGDEEETEVGRSRENPAREDPGHPGHAAVGRCRNEESVARRAAPRKRAEGRPTSRAVAPEEG